MFNVGTSAQFQISNAGLISNYNGLATVNNGIAVQVAVINLSNQNATINNAALYTSSDEGFYRVSYMAIITTAATDNSSLTLRIKYSDPDLTSDVVVPPTNLEPINSVSSNIVGGNFSGSMLIYVKSGSNITYKATYGSSGATAMVYTIRIVLEKL